MKARYFFLVCFSCMIATLLCGITSLYSTQNEIQVAYASDFLGYVAISTPEDLANIDNDKFGKYYLKNDINLAGRMWKPIADFRGVLDGQGHSISTIVFESGRNLEEGIGVFANTFKEAEIKNVSINNATIFAHDIVGVVNCGFIAGKNLGAITNCNVKGNIKAVSSLNSNKSDLSVGGIVGKNDHGTISDCNVQGSINAESFLNCVAGGIVGRNEYGTIENCYADVDICSKSQKSEACAMGTSGKSNGALKESRNISFGKKQAQSAPSFAENNGNDMPLSIKSKDNTSISIETDITNVPLYSTIIVNNDNWFDDKKSVASLAINGAGYYSVCLYNSLGQKYAYELKLLVSPIINGIEDEGLYYGSVEPQIEGGEELLLDGKPYVGGAINTCGNHTLEVLGLGNYKRTINFVVEPTINNVDDHQIYKLGVAPIIGGGELLLDGKPYVSGTAINICGNHTLEVLGIGNYQKAVHFVVEPAISNIQNGTNYAGSVLPKISGGFITLNGLEYSGSDRITVPGKNVIKIFGEGNYCKTIEFNVVMTKTGFENGQHTTQSITPVISGGTLKLNGEDFENGTKITKIGKYSLSVFGNGDYQQTFTFEILPIIYSKNIVSTGADFIFESAHKDTIITLNGELLTGNNERISQLGNYTLLIINTSVYREEFKFVISGDCAIKDNMSSDTPLTINKQNAQMFLDDEEIYGNTLVDTNGKHKLVIKGTNGYEETIIFTYINPYYKMMPYFASALGLLLLGAIILMVARRKVI